MRRREFVTLLGGATVAWPFVGHAQQRPSLPRIGFLTGLPVEDAEGQARLAACMRGLTEAGWTVGRNLALDYRAAGRDPDRYGQYAAELVALAPDVLVFSRPCSRQPVA